LGLSSLARPNILIFTPLVLVWMYVLFKQKLKSADILRRWFFFCLGVLLLILPVTLRNYLVGNDLVLIGWQGGYNFYLGNNPQATGWSVTAAQIDVTWEGGYHDAIQVAQEETGRSLKPSEVSSFWYRKGINFILSSPWCWTKLMLKKTGYFWKGYEIPNDKNFYLYRQFSSVIKVLLTKSFLYLPFGMIGPLSILGLVVSFGKWKRYLLLYLFILSYSVSVMIFFICSRFRMPVIPFLITFSSFFLYWLWEKIRQRNFRSLAISSSALLLLVIWSNAGRGKIITDNQQSAQDHFLLATTYKSLGKTELAIREYQTALKFDPRFADAYNNLGIIYGQLGKPTLALEQFQKAIYAQSDFAKALFNLGIVYQQLDSLDQAEVSYFKALQIDPQYETAHLNLGKVYFRKGMKEKAREEWKRVLEINPNNNDARQCLQLK
jgi:Tfp pilus assembly protein PilF